MAESAEDAVLLKSNDGQQDTAILHKKLFNKADRVKRGLQLTGIFWLVALCMLPIPVVHFTVLPSLLIAGPIAGFIRFRALEANEHVSGKCPVCKQEVSIPVEANEKLPMHKYCPACDKPVQVLVPS